MKQFVAILMASIALSAQPNEPETLFVSCAVCTTGSTVFFAGTGYEPLNGNARYGITLSGTVDAGFGITQPDSSGTLSASGSFLRVGPYHACTVIAARNKPSIVLACVDFIVQ